MTEPFVSEPRKVATDTTLLESYLPLPGLGVLPVNAYLIHGTEPVLVDTGVAGLSDAFMHSLETCIDPADIRWIWLTHADADHAGSLHRVLERAPRAKLITTFLGMGKLGLTQPVSPDRCYLLNPGERLQVGDRELSAFRPPSYDAPETTALSDEKTKVLFSSDCFGGVLPRPVESAAELGASELRDGIVTWTTIDAPWLADFSQEAFSAAVRRVRSTQASMVLSSHLPPAPRMMDALIEGVNAARSAKPFVGPDQRAFAAMLSAA